MECNSHPALKAFTLTSAVLVACGAVFVVVPVSTGPVDNSPTVDGASVTVDGNPVTVG